MHALSLLVQACTNARMVCAAPQGGGGRHPRWLPQDPSSLLFEPHHASRMPLPSSYGAVHRSTPAKGAAGQRLLALLRCGPRGGGRPQGPAACPPPCCCSRNEPPAFGHPAPTPAHRTEQSSEGTHDGRAVFQCARRHDGGAAQAGQGAMRGPEARRRRGCSSRALKFYQ